MAPKSSPKAAAPTKKEEKPRLKPPDKTDFEVEVESIEQDIEFLQEKQMFLADRIAELSTVKVEFDMKMDELRTQLVDEAYISELSCFASKKEFAKFLEAQQAVQLKMCRLEEDCWQEITLLESCIELHDALRDQLARKIKERSDVCDAFKAKEQEYNAYLNELRKVRREKAAQERAEIQKEYDLKKKIEELDKQPYVAEITLVKQTISFCKSLAAPKAEAKKEEKKEIKLDNPNGTQVLLRKEDREEDYFIAPTKGRRASKKAKSASDSTAAKPIKHNAETFRLFNQLKLDAPITTEEIPSLLEKLEAMLADYHQKVKEWEKECDYMKKQLLEDLANGKTQDNGD